MNTTTTDRISLRIAHSLLRALAIPRAVRIQSAVATSNPIPDHRKLTVTCLAGRSARRALRARAASAAFLMQPVGPVVTKHLECHTDQAEKQTEVQEGGSLQERQCQVLSRERVRQLSRLTNASSRPTPIPEITRGGLARGRQAVNSSRLLRINTRDAAPARTPKSTNAAEDVAKAITMCRSAGSTASPRYTLLK